MIKSRHFWLIIRRKPVMRIDVNEMVNSNLGEYKVTTGERIDFFPSRLWYEEATVTKR